MSSVKERFLNYVTYDTQSDPNSTTVPTTAKQLVLADVLAKELKALGVSGVRVSQWGCVYGYIPATAGMEDKKAVGFIAHMDTSPDSPGAGVKPREFLYTGGDIVINRELGVVISATEFSLEHLIGQHIITTDGTTLLGGDDKAGIAEIMAAAELILASDEPHGKICIAFTPDEEVGQGPDHFEVENFGAEFAYTLDGGPFGGMSYENFNAASGVIHFIGKGIHPGSAKDKLINANELAMEFHSMLPPAKKPEHTCMREGFYHLGDMQGSVEEATLEYILRDHDMTKFTELKTYMLNVADYMNRKYGYEAVKPVIKDSYFNMLSCFEGKEYVIDLAKQAMRDLGTEPDIEPIRGGTDGATLSHMGLPCPNLCTGGENAHGRYELVSVDGMEKCVQLVLRIVELTAKL